jgi:3-hydroxyacyl-[acyl-carrier-protein] dehydratase
MRWIWIDRFLDFQSRQSARAVKNLSLAEDHFRDHLPGYPIHPATLMLEGLAQTGGILVGEANDFQEKVVLAKVPSVRVYREVLAGEQITYDVQVQTLRPEGASIQGRVLVGEELVLEAEIFFAHLDKARSGQLFGDFNFVFSGELKKMVDRARKVPAG